MVDPIVRQIVSNGLPPPAEVPAEWTLTARALAGDTFANLKATLPEAEEAAPAVPLAAAATLGWGTVVAASAGTALAITAAGFASHYFSKWYFQKSFAREMNDALKIHAPGPTPIIPVREPVVSDVMIEPRVGEEKWLLKEEPVGDPRNDHQAIGDPGQFPKDKNPLDDLTAEDWGRLTSVGSFVVKERAWDGLIKQTRYVALASGQIRVERKLIHDLSQPVRPQQALVLDDREKHQNLTRKYLEGLGFQVTVVSTLSEAQKAVQLPFDLIVSDLDLGPRLWDKLHALDGVRFVRWLAKTNVATPVILHSTLFDGTAGETFRKAISRLVTNHPRVIVQPKHEIFTSLYGMTPAQVAVMGDWQKVGFAGRLADEMLRTGRELLGQALQILRGPGTEREKKKKFAALEVTGEKRIRFLISLEPHSDTRPYRNIFNIINSSMGNGLIAVLNGFQLARDRMVHQKPLEQVEQFLADMLSYYQEGAREVPLVGLQGVRVDIIRFELVSHLLGMLSQNAQQTYLQEGCLVFEGLAQQTKPDDFLPADFWPLEANNVYLRAFAAYLGFPIAVDPAQGKMVVDLRHGR